MIRNGEWGFNLVFSEKMKGEDQGYKGDVLRKKRERGEHLGDSGEKRKKNERKRRKKRKRKKETKTKT